MAIGVTWYAFIVSSMSSIIGGFDTYNATMREKMNKLNGFMRDANLPKHLRTRLRDHLEQATFDKANAYEAQEVMRDLPAVLRTDVLMYIHRTLIVEIDYLDGKTKQFTVRIVSSLRPMFVQTGDYIVEEGGHAEDMYFLTHGVGQLIKFSRGISLLEEGCYFGEIGCMLSDIRHATILAMTFCELYSLMKKDLLDIMADYPHFAIEMRQKAVQLLSSDHDLFKRVMLEKKEGGAKVGKEVRRVAVQRQAILREAGLIPQQDVQFYAVHAKPTSAPIEDPMTRRLKKLEKHIHEELRTAQKDTLKRIEAIMHRYETVANTA